MNYSILNLWNPAVIDGRVPLPIFNTIKQNCLNKVSTIPHNQYLAGNIKEEYLYLHFQDPDFESFIVNTYKIWRSIFYPYQPLGQNQTPKISSAWVNYQKKWEYNPNHSHGGDASFVIWVSIPYNLEEELKSEHYTKQGDPLKKAAFEFTYSTIAHGIQTHTIWLSSADEGRILMFPNQMIHCVYPFSTSDSDRISIAGNVYIENN